MWSPRLLQHDLFLCLAVLDAFGQLWPRAEEHTADTAGKCDVLLRVFVVEKLRELCEQGADITVSVDDVCSLGQTNITNLELSKFLWVIKIEVIDDREGVTDGVGQATTACFIETRGEAINNAK